MNYPKKNRFQFEAIFPLPTKTYIFLADKGFAPTPPDLGADFKNNQTTKQVNNSIWTNKKQVKFCFYLPIGPNKNCLIVLLFDCF